MRAVQASNAVTRTSLRWPFSTINSATVSFFFGMLLILVLNARQQIQATLKIKQVNQYYGYRQYE